jgi:hypothetical protein
MIGLAMLTLENIQAQEAAAAQEEDELLISKKLFEDLVAAMEWYNNAPLDDPIEVHSAQREARFAPVWERVKQEARAHGDPMATMEERLARALVSDDYAGRQLYFLIVESYMREKATWQDFCGELNERTRLVGQAVLAVEKIQAQEVAVQDAEPQTKHR